MVRPNPKLIERLTSLIVTITRPQRIILFGSAARGTMNRDSDIDLMVVMPKGSHRRQTAQKIYREIRGIKTPFDIVVATPDDLRQYGNRPGHLYHDILHHGKEIYAA